MYEYVESGEVKRYRSFCSRVMEEVRDDLYDSFGINTNFSLVGSGGDAEIWLQEMETHRLIWTITFT